MSIKNLIIASALFAAVATPVYFSAPLLAEEKADHKHDHEKAVAVGEATLNGVAFTVSLIGDVHPGEEVEIKLTPKGELPAGVVRGWIGIESGKGSVKGKSHKEEGDLCVHAEVPKPIPADAKVWVEIDVDGNKSKVSLGLPKGDH